MFFFSSRRRHTRSLRDWSSDVCSSDLPEGHDVRAVPRDGRRGARGQTHLAGARLLRRILQDHQRPGSHASRVPAGVPGALTEVAAVTDLRWDVPSAERLAELVAAPLPLGLAAGAARRTFHRDLYFDTPAGALGRRVEIEVPVKRSEEHTSELQSRRGLVRRPLLERKKYLLHQQHPPP